MPLPTSTLQILWMNFVADGVPGLALGLEPNERDGMRRPPHAPGESIFSRDLGRHVLLIGLLLALFPLAWDSRLGRPAIRRGGRWYLLR
jgi:Ca2+-transporting ATPase